MNASAPRPHRALRITLLVLASLLLLIGAAAGWLLFTTGGARFALARAEGMLAPRLSVQRIDGRLAGPLHVEGLRWNDPAAGIDFTLARADLDVALRDLFGVVVHVRALRASGIVLALTPVPPQPKTPSTRAPLDPPIDVLLDRVEVTDARVLQAGVELVNLRTAQLSGHWTDAELKLERLDVLATQGEVHFAGTVAGRDRYRGDGQGRFRWKFGAREVAGTLQARASEAQADLTLAATAPATANLHLQLQQQAPWPWNWQLELPAFDPSRELLPGSSLKRLAAQLRGEGTQDQATITGNIQLNETPLEVRTLTARREDERVALAGELGFNGGRVSLDGGVETKEQPVQGRFVVDWQGLSIPADLVGQELRTQGRLQVNGNAEHYAAGGTLQLGPPGRLAHIQLQLSGDREAVQLAQLDVVQPQGRLAIAGRVGLQPSLTWTLAASARRFDPGAILSDWPGRLDFRLASDGALRDGAPVATLALQDLAGTLRNRRLAGRADLALTADKLVRGDAELSSGGSRVTIAADGANRQVEAVDARFDVNSLGDWLPGARGSVRGTVHSVGRWPELDIDLNLQANELSQAGLAVDSATVRGRVQRPLMPSGNLRLDASGVAAGGFEFRTLRLTAEGDQASHRASFDASGPRLVLGADVSGGLDQGRWSGTLSRLQVAAPQLVSLALQAPATLGWAEGRANLGQTCLADGSVRLCVEGESGPAPQLRARYSVQALPLGLAQALTALPLSLDGTLDGDGDIRRDETGAVAGEAHLRSARGRIAEPTSRDEPPRELLAWRDLNVDASLAGETARVEARAGLNQDGSLSASGTANGLTSAAPSIDGQLEVRLPGLGVVEAFVPQLVNVQGTLAVQARAQGPLDAPQLTGEARLEGLGFDLPEIGLKPREGRFVVRLDGQGPARLEGTAKSGDGQLQVQGEARLDGAVEVHVSGTRVLAADIPGVKLVASPDLDARYADGRLDLEGKLVIPSADVNLQRLPSAKRTRSASPDVVVVDAPAAETEAARQLPIYATVDIQLGDAVKITGYGLDAAVTGALTVRERPADPTTASGELRVTGGYKAYGQDLTIQQGQLLYAGTPVDNPRLAITAVRMVDTVTAGFRVAGSARNPELTVFSDPAMGQANALSYIVAGKPLDQIGQGTGEGDALQSAARQLGTAAGGLLAKNVGKRLGVDEVGIKDTESVGGAALTVGQYLSPRLYLSYGVGLFEPGQVVTLRYRLSRSLAIEAEQGTLSSRAGIQYRTER